MTINTIKTTSSGVKLIYCTSIAFSNKLGNRAQVRAMAREFQKILRDNFWLGVNYKNMDDPSIKIICFSSAKSYVLAWRYMKFIGQNKIDWVYCREARLLFFLILLDKIVFHRRLKFIYEIHALLARDRVDAFIDKFLSRRVSLLIFITENLRRLYLKKYNSPLSKTLLAPDAVDLAVFDLPITQTQARQQLGLPWDKNILIYTGKFKTMEMDKGIKDILAAVKILNNPQILFVAVGGSPKEIAFYQDLIDRENLNQQVKLMPFCTQEDLAIYQKAADILMMPFPKNEHYSFFMSPLKMFEYLAAQRPIIATDLPSVKEVLNNQNAIFCQPDDPADLAQKIKQVLIDNVFAQKIAAQAYQDAHKYTWEKRVGRIIDLIK